MCLIPVIGPQRERSEEEARLVEYGMDAHIHQIWEVVFLYNPHLCMNEL
jgi:hypothetical protein